MRKFVLALISAAFLGGCSDGAGPESSSSVSIRFGIAESSAMAWSSDDGSLHVPGSNGDLDITAIWLIVEEFELEPVEHFCHDDLGGHVHCPDFELEFFFIDVPLDPLITVTVVTADIPDGTYDELEFEVDDVHLDLDDPEEMGKSDLIDDLREAVLMEFPDWPEKASMVVVGTWTPRDANGDLIPGDEETFTTYFEAEIEVEMDLDPVLTIVSGEVQAGGATITILLMPDVWFRRADGTVWNLADLQDELVEFELEIEDGFKLDIEIDDDD